MFRHILIKKSDVDLSYEQWKLKQAAERELQEVQALAAEREEVVHCESPPVAPRSDNV